jgi:phenylalanyl-tRNA synthetase alpha chain
MVLASHFKKLKGEYMIYINEQEQILRNKLSIQTDPHSLRMQKLLLLPDLTRTPGSPLHSLVQRILTIPVLSDHEQVEIPEIVPVEINFDLLGHPEDHPARSPGDTYYIDKTNVLRAQTTCMWPYYLRDPQIVRKLDINGYTASVCYGKVYRKDEVDRSHYPVFHQIDGLLVAKRSFYTATRDDLAMVLIAIAKAVFGDTIKWKLEDDSFPFTVDSIQLSIYWNNTLLEIVGAGLVNPDVLKLLNLDPMVYNGWAFGFGLDRLAMIRKNIPDIRLLWSDDQRVQDQLSNPDSLYVPVSKYPATSRDISMILGKSIAINDLFLLIYDTGNALIEEITVIDNYSDDQKFGIDKKSITLRIIYRSHVRTLLTEEINLIQETIRLKLVGEFNVVLR